MHKSTFYELLLVFFMVVVAYGYFSPVIDANTNSRLALVKAFVDERVFSIDTYHEDVFKTQDKARFKGHYYSDKAIGSALLGIEFYRPVASIAQRFLGRQLDIKTFIPLITFLAIGLISAFLAPFFYSFVKQVSGHAGFSLLMTIAVCLGTPFFVYSTLFYGHSPVGMLLFVVFFIWFSMQNEDHISLMKTFASGLFIGYAFITEYPTALISSLLSLYILYVLWRKKQLFNFKVYLLLFLGAFFPVLVSMLYHYVVFRNPFTTGYAFEFNPIFSEAHQQGFMGIGWPDPKVIFYMTFHTTMGIFWQSPVLLLAFVGWIAAWVNVRYRAEVLLSFGVVAAYLLVFSGYYMWWGGESFTPRDLIPTMPFFGIALAFLPKKMYKVSIIFVLISLVQMFVVSAATRWGLGPRITGDIVTDSYYAMFQNSTMYDVFFQHFFEQVLVDNRGQLFHLTGYASLLPLLVIEVVLVLLFVKLQTSLKKKAETPAIS
jgi:hypothetical protein